MAGLHREKYLRKLAQAHSIDSLAALLREILRDVMGIRYQYTFEELKTVIKKRKLVPEVKSAVQMLCQRFQDLEYSQKKSSKVEMDIMHEEIRTIIRDLIATHVEDRSFLGTLMNKAEKAEKEKKNQLHKKQKVKEGKEAVEKETKEEVLDLIDHMQDKEFDYMQRYALVSHELGISRSQLRTELHALGFHREKINDVMKTLH
ncbi:hypothetical protein GOV09_05800 [Candidatus Woesearchaeota archaeon]|nr:hypothetical protein [Candidatus Woesearchaeota archaeon]